MNFLASRSVCALRGPLGQRLPWNVASSSKCISMTSANLSALIPTNQRCGKEAILVQQVNQMESQRRAMSSDHVTLWKAERALTVVMIPILPMAFLMPSCTMDYLLAITFAIHSHWGVEAIVCDYVRPSVFGDVIPKIAVALVYGLTTMTLGGLCYFVYNDVGIVNAIKMLWKL